MSSEMFNWQKIFFSILASDETSLTTSLGLATAESSTTTSTATTTSSTSTSATTSTATKATTATHATSGEWLSHRYIVAAKHIHYIFHIFKNLTYYVPTYAT